MIAAGHAAAGIDQHRLACLCHARKAHAITAAFGALHRLRAAGACAKAHAHATRRAHVIRHERHRGLDDLAWRTAEQRACPFAEKAAHINMNTKTFFMIKQFTPQR